MATSRAASLVFRQLFAAESSTYTYLIADRDYPTEALIIDPVEECVERDTRVVQELGLSLKHGINTHCHADHVTGTYLLKSKFPLMKSAISAASGAQADVFLSDNQVVTIGRYAIECRATPGHTDGCMSFVLLSDQKDPLAVFTGDALLIRGCGRTDFQQGDSRKLYESVHTRIFTLPDTVAVYPAHDYRGFTSSSVAEEKQHNPRLTKSVDDFVGVMAALNLPKPKLIDVAVPANLKCGVH
ncbi:Ethylmalonic encephalopathy 1 [Entophlyctis luteolus]|nr:Ethylmalonic encephalopathy 1 [Entophlyctis luteolus]